MSKISVINLNKSYGDKTVLNNLSIDIEYGNVVCIMGSSGCGKTTLTNILLGFEQPDSGTVNGVPDNVSAVFQENRLCEDFTALSNVKMVLSDKNARDISKNALSALGLEDALDKPVKTLSGGMKRRVAIARALVAKSEFVILDEPFKGLDENTKGVVVDYVKNCIKGKTVLLVTHDINEAIALGAVIYKMVDGKIE